VASNMQEALDALGKCFGAGELRGTGAPDQFCPTYGRPAHIPHPRRSVARPGDNARSVGAERGIDLATVPLELEDHFAAGDVPHSRGSVSRRGEGGGHIERGKGGQVAVPINPRESPMWGVTVSQSRENAFAFNADP
jgi:hypothetical protein